MQIRPKQTLANNKLLLLYLLYKSDIALSELQIVRILSELSFMSYFDLKECMFELSEGGHIYSKATPQNVLYGITEKGAQMLLILEADLRRSFRDRIDSYLKEHATELKMESQLVGEFIKLSDGEYRVILKVLEDDRTIFELSCIVYSKEEAQRMTGNWRSNAISLYKDVVTRLG